MASDFAANGGPGNGAGESPLMETLKRFEWAHRRRSAQGMRACFHDDALIESVASRGEALGADETTRALVDAFGDGVYSIGDWQYEELAPDAILSTTGSRRRLPDGGMRDESVCRLITGRAGLMWRVKLFRRREDAVEYLERHGLDLGLAAGAAGPAAEPV